MAHVLTDAQGNVTGLRDDVPPRIEPSGRVPDALETAAPSKAELTPYPQDVDELHLKMMQIVRGYVQAALSADGTPERPFAVGLVWQCHILGNRKCLFRTDLMDGRYYELTYSSLRREFYLDVYQKVENKRIEEDA